MKISEVEIDSMRFVAVKHVGSYDSISTAFEKLCGIMEMLPQGKERKFIAIYYDDPEKVPVNELRSAACIEVFSGENLSMDGASEVILNPGRYAVYHFVGSYDGLGKAWKQFAGELGTRGYKFRDAPAFEMYLSDMETTPPEQLETDLYFAIA